MIDLIALDLDGTLLNSQEEISPLNRKAIRDALELGVRIVLVTGRGVDTPIRISRELNLNLPVICCHGALTKDFGANRTLGHIPVPIQYAKPMIEYGENNDLDLAIYSEETFYRLHGTELFMADMTGPAWKTVKTFGEVLHTAPTFIRFLGQRSVDAMRREFGDLPLHFKYETWNDFIECAVTSRDAGKQPALARLCADFQIESKAVLAIGDSRNDLPMLRWAGVGVAMGNALLEVREALHYVTGTNDQDGVAAAIEKFVLSKPRRAEK
nr:Cof-type HAD-IIB family hydrolase [Candidatus Eremiobacteraeota bacterium]